MAEKMHGVCLGYPILSNLLPLQEMIDHSFSAIATNQAAHGVQNVIAPRGSAVSLNDIGGMNFISYTPQNIPGGGKPEALQLTKTAPETFQFIPMLLSHMQQISNINSAMRGEPPAGVKAGVAIATLTANSLEFINSFSKAWSICWERSMEIALDNYKNFGHLPHTVVIKGQNGVSVAKDFTGSDLSDVKGVKFQLANPMMATIAGRSEIAEKLLPTGLLKSAQQYFAILDGAPISTIYENELSETDLINDENQALTEGGQVQALSTDDHAQHIRAHMSLLNKTAVRNDSARVQMILEHSMKHYELNMTTDPMLLAMVRTGMSPQRQAPMGQPSAPQGNQEQGEQKPANPAKPIEEDKLGRPI